jgi:hypothetical protein
VVTISQTRQLRLAEAARRPVVARKMRPVALRKAAAEVVSSRLVELRAKAAVSSRPVASRAKAAAAPVVAVQPPAPM